MSMRKYYLFLLIICFNFVFALTETEGVHLKENKTAETKNHFYFSLGSSYHLDNFFKVNKILENSHYNFYFKQRALEEVVFQDENDETKKIANSDFFYFDFGLDAKLVFNPYNLFFIFLFSSLEEGVQRTSLFGTSKIFSRKFNFTFSGDRSKENLVQNQKLKITYGSIDQDFLNPSVLSIASVEQDVFFSNRSYFSVREEWKSKRKSSSYYSSSAGVNYQWDYFQGVSYGKHYFDFYMDTLIIFNKLKFGLSPLLNINFFEKNSFDENNEENNSEKEFIFDFFFGGTLDHRLPQTKRGIFLFQTSFELKGESKPISLADEHVEGKYLFLPKYQKNEKDYQLSVLFQIQTPFFKWNFTPYLKYYLNLRQNIHTGYFVTPIEVNHYWISGLKSEWKILLGKIIHINSTLNYIFLDEKKYFSQLLSENNLTFNISPLSSKVVLSFQIVHNLFLITDINDIVSLENRLNTSSQNLDFLYEYTYEDNIFFSFKIKNAFDRKNYLLKTTKLTSNRIFMINVHYVY